MKFTSTKLEKIDSDTFALFGDLTLKGVTWPVKLRVEFNCVTKDPLGGERDDLVVTGKINRSDWDVNFNGALETGGVMLSEEVRLFNKLQTRTIQPMQLK